MSEQGIENSRRVSLAFRHRKFGFTPHDLRHAYNHRGRVLGIPSNILAMTLGHSETENMTTYAKHMALETKREALESAIGKPRNKSLEMLTE
jgi:integrase